MTHALRVLVFLLLTLALPVTGFGADKKPVVAVLATGGTIAGGAESDTTTIGYKAAVFGVDKLLAAVPALGRVADIRAEQVFQLASENMTPAHWLVLGKRVNQALKDPDVAGVVITHGTDTLEETAYFLNLTVRSDKPVVVTGSMRPATAISADGPINLFNAVCLAASPEARGKGVFILMNDTIFAARDTTKTNTFRTDTFAAPDTGPLGVMQLGRPLIHRLPVRAHTVSTEFDIATLTSLPQVEILYGYAGSHPAQVTGALATGARGIVNAGTGNGSLPDASKQAFAGASAKGVVVVRASRTGSGVVTRNGEVDDDALGFVAAGNLTAQKARVLLALALTVTADRARIQKMFDTY